MADYNFIEYTPETAEAIKKARSLPPSGSHLHPYPDIQKQQFLYPPQQLIETESGSESEIKGPFTVGISNGKVVVYDSSLGGYDTTQYAGIVTIGNWNYYIDRYISDSVVENGTVYFDIVYDVLNGYSFQFIIGTFPEYTGDREAAFRIGVVSNGYVFQTRSPGDIIVTGRFV